MTARPTRERMSERIEIRRSRESVSWWHVELDGRHIGFVRKELAPGGYTAWNLANGEPGQPLSFDNGVVRRHASPQAAALHLAVTHEQIGAKP